MTVTFYGQPEHLADPPPTLALTLVSETIIVAVVQVGPHFLSLQIYVLEVNTDLLYKPHPTGV